jgi:hypothetical protein
MKGCSVGVSYVAGFVKYAIEMVSGGMLCIPSLMMFSSGN